MKKTKVYLHVLALITILLWSLNSVLTRIAVQYYTPEAMSFLRYGIAAIVLFIYASMKKMQLPAKKDVPLFFLGGAVGFAVYVYAFNMGCKTVMASVATLIISSSPFITAVLAQIFLKEKIVLVDWISILCAFLGVGVITVLGDSVAFSAGILWICFAAILLSVYNVYQRKLLLRYSPLEITTYCIIAGALLLLVFAPQAIPQFVAAPVQQIMIILFMGVFSAAIAYVCWAYALRIAEKTSEVTNYLFLTPIFATFLGFFILNELPNVYTYIGGALVLAGILLSNCKHKQKA